jgi:hypothetical protein
MPSQNDEIGSYEVPIPSAINDVGYESPMPVQYNASGYRKVGFEIQKTQGDKIDPSKIIANAPSIFS